MTDEETTPKRSKRGFASMDPAKQREIAQRGGKAAHARGTAHKFSSEEAREAGKKGGAAVAADRAHMSEIGRKGGEARDKQYAHARRQRPPSEPSKEEVEG
jgi:general stress protein YciG